MKKNGNLKGLKYLKKMINDYSIFNRIRSIMHNASCVFHVHGDGEEAPR